MFLFACGFSLWCYLNILGFVNCAVLPNAFRLDIVHYNDFHSRFEETSLRLPVCETNDNQCLGGFARLYYEIKALLREKPDALLLNAGDTFQGTYWYTLLKWNATQTFINLLPNDAHAIGNHEFDDGVAGLAPYLAGLTAPVVAANMDASKEPILNGLYQPHVILERKGRKIGIIGLMTTETVVMSLSNPKGVVIQDPIEVVQREAQLLTEMEIDIIVVLSHCGLDVDIEMAKKVGENIDIIVGGHTHSLLWNGTSPSHEEVSGPYPMLVKTETKPEHTVLVVTASALTKYLGNLTTYFDETGELVAFDGNPVYLNRSIPEDTEIKALMQPYMDEIHKLVQEVVGYNNDDLLHKTCGAGECAIGDLTADAFMNATRQKITTNLPSVAFLLRNMIKGSFSKGGITRGRVMNALPYDNEVVTFVLYGRHLLEAFEMCLTNYWELKPFDGAWMPHVSGIKLTLNPTAGRVVSALIKDGEEYQEVDPDMEYQVTTVKFLLTASKKFAMLRENARNVQTVGIDAVLVEDYIRQISPVNITLDNRLIVLN